MTDSPELIPEDDAPVVDERSIARRIALQALYEIDLAHHPVNEVLTIHLKTQNPSRKIVRYVQELVHGVIDNRPTLDEAIKRYAPEWPIDQIAFIDRNILRIAIYEFAVRARTPVGVAIDEAVELAKLFGADGASSFINGVLGAVADDHTWLQKVRQVESSEDGDEAPTPPYASPPELPPGDDGSDLRMSLLEHLEELRDRLFKAALGLIAGTVIGALFAGDIFKYLLKPYGRPAQVLDPTGSVTNYFRVALTFGAIIAIPLITYQILLFILPGLTKRERRILLTALPAITLLFVIGVAFAWFLMLPTAIDFLANFHSDIFTTQWTADGYLGFVTSLLFWMGAAFETPLIFFVLSILGFVNAPLLLKNWRIAVVGAAVIAAIITPTVDPVNMFLVMAPLLVLYLLSIVLTRFGSRIGSHTS